VDLFFPGSGHLELYTGNQVARISSSPEYPAHELMLGNGAGAFVKDRSIASLWSLGSVTTAFTAVADWTGDGNNRALPFPLREFWSCS
jgi:hypothetical protein